RALALASCFETHRSAFELWKHLRLSCCDAPQHEATVRGAFWPNEATWKNNPWLQETIAGSAPLFPDCYLQWMAQLQRVEPSGHGQPTFPRPERCLYFPCYLQGNSAARARRQRRQHALSARAAP